MNRWHSLPAEVFALVEQSPATVLLECGKPATGAGNRTQLFTGPLGILSAWSPAEVPDLFAQIESAVEAGHTAAGFFTYECGNCFEPRAGLPALPAGEPLAWFGIYERGYPFDRATGTFPSGDPPQLAHFLNSLENADEAPSVDAAFELSPQQYAERIDAIHEWIRAGDVYQLNFTAPYRLKVRGSLAALYAKLSVRQPVEYGAFLHSQPGRHILSFSPELFFRIDEANGERRITTRPMKGTVARGRTTSEDRERAEWLRNDAKNRAENLMIVDLLRNDLGRLAKFGTVRTEDMFAVERYPTLWQMTSTIVGDLRPSIGFSDVFRALFPCGSITGAPKVRAMQLLAQLEGQQPRGVYTGAIGYFSPQGTVFNVAIRTLMMDGNEGTMGVGSGIVIDSVAADEYRECELKAEFLCPKGATSNAAINNKFMLIETMLWNGGFPLLELHLDRLSDSAEYFGFQWDRAQVKSALEAYAQNFCPAEQHKVRLLLDPEGEPHISSEPLQPGKTGEPARVYLAAERTDSADRWLYHKTTHRALYARVYQQATDKGFDEVLFLNERDEVTEGAISNVFVEKDGRMFTPPIESGVLPGVYRRYLLETRPDIKERVLTINDLHSADVVHISNAVRGLRKIQIEW